MAAAAPDSARFTGVLSSARGSPSRAPSRTPRATVVDAFAKYAVFSSAGASSIKGGTALIDAVIRRRVVRLEVGDGGRLQDAHFSVPAENSRSTVSTVQLPGRFLYVELQALLNMNRSGARKQPYLPMAFTVDVATRAGYVYRLAFSTEHTGLDLHLGKVARLPLPQVSDRWTVFALDMHALLGVVSDGHEGAAEYGYACGVVFHANALVRGAFASDHVLVGDALPECMAFPLPPNTRFSRDYGWVWLPAPPEAVDPAADLSKPVLDERPWKAPPRPAPGADSSRASVTAAPRRTTASSGGGSWDLGTGEVAAPTAGGGKPRGSVAAAVADAVRNASSASALAALSRTGQAGEYARLPMPPPQPPPPRPDHLPSGARGVPGSAPAAPPPEPIAAPSASSRPRAQQAPAARAKSGGEPARPAAAAATLASRPSLDTSGGAARRLPQSALSPMQPLPLASVFHADPAPQASPLIATADGGAVAALATLPSDRSSLASPRPGGGSGQQRRNSRLSTGGASVGSSDSAQLARSRSRSPTAQGHQSERQYDNPAIEPYRHHVAELANGALYDTQVSVDALHAAADAALGASGVGQRISVPASDAVVPAPASAQTSPQRASAPVVPGLPLHDATPAAQAGGGEQPQLSSSAKAVAAAVTRETPPPPAASRRPALKPRRAAAAAVPAAAGATKKRPSSAPPSRARPAAPPALPRATQAPQPAATAEPIKSARAPLTPARSIKPLPTPAELAAAATSALLDETVRLGRIIEVRAPAMSPGAFSRRGGSATARQSLQRIGGNAGNESFVSAAAFMQPPSPDAEAEALSRLRDHLHAAAHPAPSLATGSAAPTMTLRSLTGVSGEVLGGVQWAVGGTEVFIPTDRSVIALAVQGPHVGPSAAQSMANVRAGSAEDGNAPSVLGATGQRLFMSHHTERIVALATSPDGRLLATAQAGKAPYVILWCIRAARHVALLTPASHGLADGLGSGSLTFSADGSLLALAGRDERGRPLITVLDVRAPQAAALAMAIAFDAAAASATGTSASSGVSPPAAAVDADVPLVARQVSDFHIFRLRFSPYVLDRLVSVGRENVRLWRIRRAHLPGVSIGLSEYARGVVFTDVAFEPTAAAPEARHAETGSGGAASGEEQGDDAADQPGSLLVVSSAGTMLRVDYASRALQGVHRLHEGACISVGVNDGFCVTAGLDGFVRVWPLDFSDFYLEAAHEGGATSAAISPNGLMVAVGTAAMPAACTFAVADEAPTGGLLLDDLAKGAAAARRRPGGSATSLVSGTNPSHVCTPPPGARSLTRPGAFVGTAPPLATVGLIDVVTQQYRAVQRGHASSVTALTCRPVPPLIRAPESMVLESRGGSAPDKVAAAARSLLGFSNASRALWGELLPLVPREVCTAAADGMITVWVFKAAGQQTAAAPTHGGGGGFVSPRTPRRTAPPGASPRGSPLASPRKRATAYQMPPAPIPDGSGGLWEPQFEFSASGDRCMSLAYKPLFDATATSALLQAVGAFDGGGAAGGITPAGGSIATLESPLMSPRSASTSQQRRQQLQALVESCHVLACGFSSGAVRVFHVPTSMLLHDLRSHRAGVAAVAYVPDGSSLLSAGCDGRLIMWDCARAYAAVRVFVADVPRGAVLSGATLAVAGDCSAAAVSFGEVLGIAPITAVAYGSRPKPAPLLPVSGGKPALSGGKGGGVLGRLLAPPVPASDASEGSDCEGEGLPDAGGLGTSPGRVYVLSPSDLRVLAMAALRPLMPAKMRSMAAAAAAELAALSSVSVSGARLSPASRAHTAALVSDLEGRLGRCVITSLAFSPDASLLVAGTADWRLAGWLVVAPRPTLSAPTALSLVRTFELSGAHTGAIHSVGILGDGTVLYSSGADSSVRLWQTAKLIPRGAPEGPIETETSVGAYHPAAITQANVAGGALVHVCDEPRGGCIVSAHEAYRALFDFGLSGAMPFGTPKNPAEMSNAGAVDAAIAMYAHNGAPRSTPCFRLAAAPPPRPVLQPLAASSPSASSRRADPDVPGSPGRLGSTSPRRTGPAGRPTLADAPAPESGTDMPPLKVPSSPVAEAGPPDSVAFSPPRTAAARAADLAASTARGRLSPPRLPPPAEAAAASDSDDNDLAPASYRRPLHASSLGGGSDDDGATSSVEEPFVSGLDGESGAGSESWWAGNTDPATWHDLEPTAVPQALLQGLVDLLDGKRGHPKAIAAAASPPPTAALPAPMEPTHIVRVRRSCLDVAPLALSTAEVRSRRNRPPGHTVSGSHASAVEAIVSYTRSSFAWDAFASRVLYCAGSEVTVHDASSGKQFFLPVRAWADLQHDAVMAQRRREAASSGNAAALVLLTAPPSSRRPSSCSGTPAAVTAAASRRRHPPRCTVLSISADGLMMLVGLSDCSIGLWQRSAASPDAMWEQTAVLLPPWVHRNEPPAAAASAGGPRHSAMRRASLVGSAKVAHGFGGTGSSGVLADASFGPGRLFIAATYIKHAAGGGRSFRVLVAFWEVADVLARLDDARFVAARAARLAAAEEGEDLSGPTNAPSPPLQLPVLPVLPQVATAIFRARPGEVPTGQPIVTRIAWIGMPTIALATGGRLMLCSVATRTHSGADDVTVHQGARATVGAALGHVGSEAGGSVARGGGADDAASVLSEPAGGAIGHAQAMLRARRDAGLPDAPAPGRGGGGRRNSLASVAVFTAESGSVAGPGDLRQLARGGGGGGGALQWRVHVTSFNFGAMFKAAAITAVAASPPPFPLVPAPARGGGGGAAAAPQGLALDLLRDYARPSRLAVSTADGALCLCALEEDVFNAVTGTGGGHGGDKARLSPGRRTHGVITTAVYIAPEGPEHLVHALRAQRKEQEEADAMRSGAAARLPQRHPDVMQPPVHIEAGLVLCVQVLSATRGTLPWPAPAPTPKFSASASAHSGGSSAAVGSTSSSVAAAAAEAARIVSLAWCGPNAGAETIVAGTLGRQVISWSIYDPVALRQAGIDAPPGSLAVPAAGAPASKGGDGEETDPDAAVLVLRHAANVGAKVTNMQWVRPDARDEPHGLVADTSGSLWYVHPPRGAVPPAALAATGIPPALVLRATRGPVRLIAGHSAAVEGVRFGTVAGGPLASALSLARHAASGGDDAAPEPGALTVATPATFLVSVGGEDGSLRVWNATPSGSAVAAAPLATAPQARGASPARGASAAPPADSESADAAAWDTGLDQIMLVQSAGGHVATAVAVSVPGTASAAYSDARHPAKALGPEGGARGVGARVSGRRGSSSGGSAASGAGPAAQQPGRIAVGFDNGAVRIFLIESLKEEGRVKPYEPPRAHETTSSSGSGGASRSSGGGGSGPRSSSPAEGAVPAFAAATARSAAVGGLPEAPQPSEVCALAWASFPAPVHSPPAGTAAARSRATTALRDVPCLVSGDRLGRVYVTVLQGGAGATPSVPLLGRAASKAAPLLTNSFALGDLAARSRLDDVDVDAIFSGRPIHSISASPFDPALVLIVGTSGAATVWRLVSSGAPSQSASGAELEPHVVLIALISANPLLTRGLQLRRSSAADGGGAAPDNPRRSSSAPVVIVDAARVALRTALLSSLAEAAVTQPSPSAYGESLMQLARRASTATGATAGASSAGGGGPASVVSGLPRGSPGGAALAEFSPASASVVVVLVPVPVAALPPAALAALQSRGQATVGQALLFYDFGAGRVLFCTPPLPQVVASMAPLPAWPAEHAELVAAQEAAAVAATSRSGDAGAPPARSAAAPGSGRPRSNSLFSNSGGSTVGRVRAAVAGGGLDVLLDDASVASEDPDALPVDGAEVASAAALELAAGGGFVLGTATDPQLLVVGAGGAARGQILAFSDVLDSPVTSVDAAFSRLLPPQGARASEVVSAVLRGLRPRWLRAFSAVCGRAVQLFGLVAADAATAGARPAP